MLGPYTPVVVKPFCAALLPVPELNFYGMGMDNAYVDDPPSVVKYLVGLRP